MKKYYKDKEVIEQLHKITKDVTEAEEKLSKLENKEMDIKWRIETDLLIPEMIIGHFFTDVCKDEVYVYLIKNITRHHLITDYYCFKDVGLSKQLKYIECIEGECITPSDFLCYRESTNEEIKAVLECIKQRVDNVFVDLNKNTRK